MVVRGKGTAARVGGIRIAHTKVRIEAVRLDCSRIDTCPQRTSDANHERTEREERSFSDYPVVQAMNQYVIKPGNENVNDRPASARCTTLSAL